MRKELEQEERKNPEALLTKIRQEEQSRTEGSLKIFFGYAAGVGKTFAMLTAAHEALAKGIDVVCGYIEPHARPRTSALCEGLEQLPLRVVQYHGMELKEFDLDAALARKPQLILVDELAHTNAQGSRHAKRYADIKELLRAGIDVYTTVNVQHIESLNDQVAAITGVTVRERIPDSVFDMADQVSLVDIEPQDLLARLQEGNVYRKAQAKRAMNHFFTQENLMKLREIALRRCADRVLLREELAYRREEGGGEAGEHVLVCLSPAPSNAKIIRTAARMAGALHSRFTALYVETPSHPQMSEENKQRFREHLRLAGQLGARIETVYGEDVAYQIGEFAKQAGVTKIVVGRSTAAAGRLWRKPTLVDRLIAATPFLDVHIIPDAEQQMQPYRKRMHGSSRVFSARDTLVTLGVLTGATLLSLGLAACRVTEANIITVYLLAIIVNAMLTNSSAYSLLLAVANVLTFNFLFTEPKYTFIAYDAGYPVTFAVMFVAALLAGSVTRRLKQNASQSAKVAYRTKMLLDTNRLLQQAKSEEGILQTTAGQLQKLLAKDIIVYPAKDGELSEAVTAPAGEGADLSRYLTENERAIAGWVFKNKKRAGATTGTLSDAKCLYLAIRTEEAALGVVGIGMGPEPLEAFENSIMLSILGECALALENEQNAREKERALVEAENEKLRSGLLRGISHDLRTPLTSISGNASNLMSNAAGMSEALRQELYADIHDDAMWLIHLVENLLSVTRLEESSIRLNCHAEAVSELIAEALKHVDRHKTEHMLTVEQEELLLVQADAGMLVQVLTNLIDNAIRYTPKGSEIRIGAKKQKNQIVITVSDNGAGIPEEAKARIFERFFTVRENNGPADGRRSLGIGLSLCKSIVTAHGGSIAVDDAPEGGARFTVTLPAVEVRLQE